jgi:alcohol dehydrogenase (cytochrome c)
MKLFGTCKLALPVLLFALAGAAAAQAPQPAPAPPVPYAGAAAAAAAGPVEGPRFPSTRNEDETFKAITAKRAALLNGLSLVTQQMLDNPPAGDWLVWRRTYEGLGYSPLEQINKRNVATLTGTWSWSLPVSPNEITPLVHDGVMFLASANRVQALDAVTGDLLWQYVRQLPAAFGTGGAAIAKNLAIHQDRLFVPTADRHLVALNVRTGAVIWDHEIIAASDVGPVISGGPIVAKDKVIIGVSRCNTYKGGCFITALDTATGAEKWRFYTIARPDQPGGDTWNGAPLDERYGGAVWIAGSYDPALNLLYFGLGQTYSSATLLAPRPGQTQVGNNDALYTDSTVALDPDTGRLAWHYQHMNRDVWDMDWVFERSLIDLPIKGVNRKVSVTAGKMAIIDVIDRTDGQYLFSKDLGLQNLVSAIDPVTGRKTINPALAPEVGVTKLVCPHAGGARAWPATAYNPRTKILYLPLVEACGDFVWMPRDPKDVAAGGTDFRWTLKKRPDADGRFGRVEAVNLETGKTVWTYRGRAPQVSAILATGGGLIFEGDRERMFRARDEMTGKILWQVRLNAVASSFPITYAVAGKQYVAVVTGGGGNHEATWINLTPEIVGPPPAITVQVFALPDRR